MVKFECDIPKSEIDNFVRSLSRYQNETQRDMRGAVRSATLDLLKSLRARTRRAPKQVPREDVRFGESQPLYITGKDGKVYKRVVVTRWYKGQRVQKVHWLLVQTKTRNRKTRNGVRVSQVEASAPMLREARLRFGGVRHWGLAKNSWGWFMKAMFHKSMQDTNPAAVVDRRMVEKEMVEKREPLPDGTIDLQAPIKCEVTIVNKLDYIRRALQPGALLAAVSAAARSINHKITAGLRSRKFGA